MSDLRPESRQNSADMHFTGIPVGAEEGVLFARFLDSHDCADNTRRAMTQDVRKFARWFSKANGEPLVVGRVTPEKLPARDQGSSRHGEAGRLVNLRRFSGAS